MSVDPFIQAPGNSQSLNPYSYVMNNPLSGTDPTGYAFERKVKVTSSHIGSRVKRSSTVTVSGKDNGKGGTTVTISGGNGAARSAVKGAIASKLSGGGFNTTIGSEASKNKVGHSVTTSEGMYRRDSVNSKISSGSNLSLSELEFVQGTLPEGQIAITKFINVLHSQKGKKFDNIMKSYGFLFDKEFDGTRTFLIDKARAEINLIGKTHLIPETFYKTSVDYGDATNYKQYKMIGFGSKFLARNALKEIRVDTVVHEFSHVIWTKDFGQTVRSAPENFRIMAQNAQYSGSRQDRMMLKNSAYVFEYAVREAQDK